MVVGYKIFNPN